MMHRSCVLSRLVIWMMFGCLLQAVHVDAQTIFSNENTGAVLNTAPQKPTQFQLVSPMHITYIRTYHHNLKGQSAVPGIIEIKSTKGVLMGSWSTTVYNRYYLTAEPNLIFPSGAYTITCKSPSNWSNNAASDFRGFATVSGTAVLNKGPVNRFFTQTLAQNIWKGPVALRPFRNYTDDYGVEIYTSSTQMKVGDELVLFFDGTDMKPELKKRFFIMDRTNNKAFASGTIFYTYGPTPKSPRCEGLRALDFDIPASGSVVRLVIKAVSTATGEIQIYRDDYPRKDAHKNLFLLKYTIR